MSDTDEDNFVEYGSALDPIDEDEVPRKKPLPLEEQVVRDKQGRQRFHGAFTGGFSAGFYNTVGSLEGWKPSTFKSSRSEKADRKEQRPEDFMDDEDTGEFGIAPTALRANLDFRTDSNKRKARSNMSDGPIPGMPVLQQLLKPTRETIGIKILKKMGWKPGQGVGPRLTKSQKRRLQAATNGMAKDGQGMCVTSTEAWFSRLSDSDETDDDHESLLFAPDDYDALLTTPKDNWFGIGYVGLDKRPVLGGHLNLFETPSLKMQEKKKTVSISGQAFGVGAFEVEDEDIYTYDDMSQYDFVLEGAPTSKEKHKSKSLQDHAKDVVEGFVLASQPKLLNKHFQPPSVPESFTPFRRQRLSRFEPLPQQVDVNSAEETAKKRGLQRHSLGALDRAHILDEPLPPQVATLVIEEAVVPEAVKLYPKEVASSHAKISKVAEELKTETAALVADALKISQDEQIQKSTDVVGRFRPFAGDPEKQKRYEQFLMLVKIGQKDRLAHLQPITMTEWEKEREQVEFEKAANLYTDVMLDRFVSARQPDDATNPLSIVERVVEPESSQKLAAKKKMFGYLTRVKSQWRPCSLLCKRFNVPEPFSQNDGPPIEEKKKPQFSVFDFLTSATHNTPANHPGFVFDKPPPTSNIVESTAAAVGITKVDVAEIADDTQSESVNADITKTVDLMKIIESSKTLGIMSTTENTADISNTRGTTSDTVGAADTATILGKTETTAITAKTTITKQLPEEEESVMVRIGPEPAGRKPSSKIFTDEVKGFEDPPEKMDLFRAIFLSSDESSSEGEDETANSSQFLSGITQTPSTHSNTPFPQNQESDETLTNLEVTPSASIIPPSEPVNIRRNTSPARGVFANIDLDTINSYTGSSIKEEVTVTKDTSSGNGCESVNDEVKTKYQNTAANEALDESVYGPRLPPSLPASQSTVSINVNSADEGIWVEKKPKHLHKHKNKHDKKYHKKSKKKQKHKHKHRSH